MNAAQISDSIRKEVESRIKVYPCNNLRASNIGHPCERYLYLLIKHWDEQKPHDYGLQNIFDLGNTIEVYTIEKIKAAGYELFTPADSKAGNWKVENPLITGRDDLRIKDQADGQLYPVEIKGLSSYEWDKLNCVEDFYASKKHYVQAYPSQLLVYMWRFEKMKGFFALTNKLTGQIKIIEVPFDWDRADALLKKGERIYKALADGTPPAACEDISICERCSLAHICTAPHSWIEADIDDGELGELIDRKMGLAPAYNEYNDVRDEIKKCVGARETVITGKYIVRAKIIDKQGYTVEPRQERRINITRL